MRTIQRTFMWTEPKVERVVKISYSMDTYDPDEIDIDSVEIWEGNKDLTPLFERLDKMSDTCIWDRIREEIQNSPDFIDYENLY